MLQCSSGGFEVKNQWNNWIMLIRVRNTWGCQEPSLMERLMWNRWDRSSALKNNKNNKITPSFLYQSQWGLVRAPVKTDEMFAVVIFLLIHSSSCQTIQCLPHWKRSTALQKNTPILEYTKHIDSFMVHVPASYGMNTGFIFYMIFLSKNLVLVYLVW